MAIKSPDDLPLSDVSMAQMSEKSYASGKSLADYDRDMAIAQNNRDYEILHRKR